MKSDIVYLEHILDCVQAIEEFTTNGKDAFFASRMIRDAVVRNLEVIGEASKKVSETTRQAQKHVPWREMAGLRDVLIHDYFGVDTKIVWNVVERELPRLKSMVKEILRTQF